MDPEKKKQIKEYHTRYMREWRKNPTQLKLQIEQE
jgi:hypothetical protein